MRNYDPVLDSVGKEMGKVRSFGPGRQVTETRRLQGGGESPLERLRGRRQ
jgi:hypothetical protein